MDLHLPQELETRLARVAGQRGIAVEALAREMLERAAGYDEWFIREVEKGLEAINLGQVLTHEEVGARLQRRLAEKHQIP